MPQDGTSHPLRSVRFRLRHGTGRLAMSLPFLAWKTTPLDLLALGTGLLAMLFLEENPGLPLVQNPL